MHDWLSNALGVAAVWLCVEIFCEAGIQLAARRPLAARLSRARFGVAMVAVATASTAGCRPSAAATATQSEPATAVPTDTFCWWTLLRTALPPDSVAARFANAYQTVGLLGVTSSRRGDTAWAHAGPTVLADGSEGAIYESRVVAFHQDDSSSFRYSVAVKPVRHRDAQVASRNQRAADNLEFCARIAKTAAIRWSTPARRPNATDSVSVWMQR